MIEFRKIPEFPRGTLYDILQDAYSFDSSNRALTGDCLYYEILLQSRVEQETSGFEG